MFARRINRLETRSPRCVCVRAIMSICVCELTVKPHKHSLKCHKTVQTMRFSNKGHETLHTSLETPPWVRDSIKGQPINGNILIHCYLWISDKEHESTEVSVSKNKLTETLLNQQWLWTYSPCWLLSTISSAKKKTTSFRMIRNEMQSLSNFRLSREHPLAFLYIVRTHTHTHI